MNTVRLRHVAFLFLVLACLASAIPISCDHKEYTWQASFLQAKYCLWCKGRTGEVRVGIELRVVDQANNDAFGFPISDYAPDKPIISDSKGALVFHHVEAPSEFTGVYRSTRILGGLVVLSGGGWELPSYKCSLIEKGSVLHEFDFRDLDRELQAQVLHNKDTPRVAERWAWAKSALEHVSSHRLPFDLSPSVKEFFFVEKTLTLD